MLGHSGQGLANEPAAPPGVLLVMYFRQLDVRNVQVDKGRRLGQGLSVELPDPAGRAVGRNDQQGQVPLLRFGHGRMQAQHGRARGDAYRHRLARGRYQSEGYESGAALIGYGVQREASFVKIMCQYGIA